MEEIQKLWLQSQKQWETLQVQSREIKRLKTGHLLNDLRPIKWFALVAGLVWVLGGSLFLGQLYKADMHQSIFFYCFLLQLLLIAAAVLIYGYQLIQLYTLDWNAPVLQTQKEILDLRFTTLWSVKIMVLQLPLGTIFWWNSSMFESWVWWQWAITGSCTALFTGVAIWLFVTIKVENREKWWLRWIFSGKEWTRLAEAQEELAGYKD